MSSESTLILVGILITLTSFIGIPVEWYVYIFSTLGLIVLGIGLLLRSRAQKISSVNDIKSVESAEDTEETKNNKISPIA